jgi:hypothetical protein
LHRNPSRAREDDVSIGAANAMMAVSGAFAALRLDQCAASIPAWASAFTQRGDRFMSTSSLIRCSVISRSSPHHAAYRSGCRISSRSR